jgi:hypothetical protein
MRRLRRLILPLVVVYAVVSFFATVAGPAGHHASPYLSALSDAFATSVYARGGCAFKDCAGGSRHNLACAKVLMNTSCTIFQGTCIAGACP